MTGRALNELDERLPLRARLALLEIDGVTLLVVPAVLFVVGLFVYPFIYGFILSFQPKAGGWLANYQKFFSVPFLYDTIAATLWLAVPATLINVLISIPIAMHVRRMNRRRILTTILVIPITLGTVLIAEGLLNYLGPQGWFNRALMLFGFGQVRLVHNYTGVMLSLILSGFPFAFLLTLSYITGIDRRAVQAGAPNTDAEQISGLGGARTNLVAIAHEFRDVGMRGSNIEILRRADLTHFAGAHHDDAVGQRQRLFLVMRHVDRRRADQFMDTTDFCAHLQTQLGVEI